MFDREGVQPLFDIDNGFHRVCERCWRSVGHADSIYQSEYIGIVVGRSFDGAGEIVVAVASEFFDATGGGELIHDAPGLVDECGARSGGGGDVVELKPGLKFVEIAVSVIGKDGINHITARGLSVFHEGVWRASIAVEQEVDVTTVVPRQPHLAHEPIGCLLALDGCIVPRTIARGVNLIKVLGAEEQIVSGNVEGVVAGSADWSAESLMVRASGVFSGDIIDRAEISIHKGSFDTLVAQRGPVDPGVHVILSHPEPINGVGRSGDRITKANQTFVNIETRSRRESAGSGESISRLNDKGG